MSSRISEPQPVQHLTPVKDVALDGSCEHSPTGEQAVQASRFVYYRAIVLRPPSDFMDEHRAMEATYIASDDPIKQSGFHGGRDRWVAERSPLIQAIDHDGTFLDIGCANGLLARDVVQWVADRGIRVEPHGIDLGGCLVQLARDRHPAFAENFVEADVWQWEPDRQFTYVYSLLDVAPLDLRCELLDRLYRLVEPGGRLILGSYRSSAGEEPVRTEAVIEACGFELGGTATGGRRDASLFAWTTPKPLGD